MAVQCFLKVWVLLGVPAEALIPDGAQGVFSCSDSPAESRTAGTCHS